MRVERLERALKLICALQAGRALTVEQLASRIGVSRRTVFRDLNSLSRAGLPFLFDRVARKYSAATAELVPPANLTHAETVALLLGARMLASFGVVPNAAVAQSAAMKLEGMLPRARLDACGPLLECIELRPPPISDSSTIADLLLTLQSALAKRDRLKVRYDSEVDRRALEMTIQLQRIVFMRRSWYVFAYWEERGCFSAFKVARVMKVRTLPSKYRLNAEFDLDMFLGNAWFLHRGKQTFHARVRFSPAMAEEVEDVRWHHTQQTYFEPDGSLIFEADVDGIGEVARWVLGFGDQAQVLEPKELQETVLGLAQWVSERYTGLNRVVRRA